MSKYHLILENHPTLNAAFGSIPDTVRHLHLRKTNLNLVPYMKLVTVFGRLKPNIDSLSVTPHVVRADRSPGNFCTLSVTNHGLSPLEWQVLYLRILPLHQ